MHRLLVLTALGLVSIAPANAQPPSAQIVDQRMIDRVRLADANGDKLVTQQEFLAYRAGQFQRLDRNRDGFLSSADTPRFAGRAPKNLDVAAMTAQFDANRDGRVSQDEFVKGPTPAFDAADANHNKVVTQAEIDAAVAAARR